jgi:hypothetical protein
MGVKSHARIPSLKMNEERKMTNIIKRLPENRKTNLVKILNQKNFEGYMHSDQVQLEKSPI